MKIVVKTNELKNCLKELSKVPEERHIEILRGYLFHASGNVVTITHSNTEITMKEVISAEVVEEGSIIIPSEIVKIVGKISDVSVSLETDENHYVTIKDKNGEIKIGGRDPEDYPHEPNFSKEISFAIKAQKLKEAIKKTVYACSNSDARPILQGIRIAVGEDIEFVATDGHRLSKVNIILDESDESVESFQAILPRDVVSVLSTISDNEETTIAFGGTYFSVSQTDKKIVSRLLEGRYPEIKNIFPSKFTSILRVNSQELYSTLDFISVINQKTVLMEFKGQTAQFIAKEERGYTRREVFISMEGDEGKVAFNPEYMMEAIASMEGSKEVLIKMTGETGPIILVPTENANEVSIHALVLPLRIAK